MVGRTQAFIHKKKTMRQVTPLFSFCDFNVKYSTALDRTPAVSLKSNRVKPAKRGISCLNATVWHDCADVRDSSMSRANQKQVQLSGKACADP